MDVRDAKLAEFEAQKQLTRLVSKLETQGLSDDQVKEHSDFKRLDKIYWNKRFERAQAAEKSYPVCSGDEFKIWSSMKEHEARARDRIKSWKDLEKADDCYSSLRKKQQKLENAPFVLPPTLMKRPKLTSVETQVKEYELTTVLPPCPNCDRDDVQIQVPADCIGAQPPNPAVVYPGSLNLLQPPLLYLPPGEWIAKQINESKPISVDLYLSELRNVAKVFGVTVLTETRVQKVVKAFQRFIEVGTSAVSSEFLISASDSIDLGELSDLHSLLQLLHERLCRNMGRKQRMRDVTVQGETTETAMPALSEDDVERMLFEESDIPAQALNSNQPSVTFSAFGKVDCTQKVFNTLDQLLQDRLPKRNRLVLRRKCKLTISYWIGDAKFAAQLFLEAGINQGDLFAFTSPKGARFQGVIDQDHKCLLRLSPSSVS